MFPQSFKKLVEQLESLPQIGSKTAERLAAYIFKLPFQQKRNLAQAILSLARIKECPRCFNFSEGGLCSLCRDKNRKQEIVAVVETPLHIASFERVGFKGVYHVLGGLIASFLENPEDLKLKELINRIKKEKPREIILALDSSLEGETTTIYIAKEIRKHYKGDLRITRLAQGLPTGADLEYADETTVREALRGRKEIVE